jgi:DNA-binding NtrC family response regulator
MEKARIVIIEDNPGWREILKETLDSEGYQLDIATTTEEGIAALRISGIQLVLMDLNLVDENKMNREGLQLLTYIGMYNPCARAIVLTAYAKHLREAFRATYGLYDYLLKQEFEKHSFLGTVREAVEEAFQCEKGKSTRPAYPDTI